MVNYMKLYASTRDAVSILSDAEAGKLFKSILNHMNDMEPLEMTGGDNILYQILRQQIDREYANAYRRREEKK